MNQNPSPTETEPRENASALVESQNATVEQLLERLKFGADGRPIDLVEIQPLTENPLAMPEIMTLLGREQPIGTIVVEQSPAPVVQANLQHGISRRLAMARRQGQAAGFMVAMRQELGDQIAEANRQLDERQSLFDECQATLDKWRRQKSTDRNIFVVAIEKLFTQEVNVFAAIDAFNRRERVNLELCALRIARDEVLAKTQNFVTVWVETLEARFAEADEQLGIARRRLVGLVEPSDPAEREPEVAVRVDVPTVVQTIVDGINPDELDGRLLESLGASQGVPLAEAVKTAARQLAEQKLAGLRVSELINLQGPPLTDGGLTRLDGVGIALGRIAARPVWPLTADAQPRIETLQIAAEERPPFTGPGLDSATHADRDTVAMLQVRLGIALEDMQFVQDTLPAMQAMEVDHNLFVIPELAAAWEQKLGVGGKAATPAAVPPAPAPAGVAASVVPAPAPGHNGQNES